MKMIFFKLSFLWLLTMLISFWHAYKQVSFILSLRIACSSLLPIFLLVFWYIFFFWGGAKVNLKKNQQRQKQTKRICLGTCDKDYRDQVTESDCSSAGVEQTSPKAGAGSATGSGLPRCPSQAATCHGA